MAPRIALAASRTSAGALPSSPRIQPQPPATSMRPSGVRATAIEPVPATTLMPPKKPAAGPISSASLTTCTLPGKWRARLVWNSRHCSSVSQPWAPTTSAARSPASRPSSAQSAASRPESSLPSVSTSRMRQESVDRVRSATGLPPRASMILVLVPPISMPAMKLCATDPPMFHLGREPAAGLR